MTPELPDRKLLQHDALAGVALYMKPAINYAVFDIDAETGEPDAQSGEWFQFTDKDRAVARYEARVAEARRFL